MDSPRLHKNLCNPLQNGAEARFLPTAQVDQESLQTKGTTAGADRFHNISTAAAVENHSSDEDRTQTAHGLPTEPHTTSDTDEPALDRTMVRLLLELATVSQVSAAPTEIQAPNANSLRLPVNSRGRALTDDPVGTLGLAYKRASLIPDRDRRLKTKEALVNDAERELHGCRYARRLTPDLGTQDGRLMVARYAREHGTRRAAEAYCVDPSDSKSIKRMQRNVQRYLQELQRVEAMR